MDLKSLHRPLSEQRSGPRPYTSSLVDPTLDTKVTEYLSSGGFFFFREILTFLTSHF